MSTGYIKSLDGVRALAIILVMTFHYGINYFGWMGVQLFFVLSGFLITGILWKEKHRDSSLSARFKKFWARRSLRIFPLYYGFLFFLLLSWLIVDFPSYFPTYIPYLATYTFNFTRTFPEWQVTPLFTHMWSLCVEEQFYLFWPLIVFLCPPRVIKGLMILVMLAAPFIRYALGIYYSNKGLQPETVADTVYWNTLSHLDAFFIGGSIPVFALGKKVRKPAAGFIVLLLLVIVAGAINYSVSGSPLKYYLLDLGYAHGKIDSYEHVWHYTLLNLCYASFLLLLVSEHTQGKFPVLARALETNWLVRIGKVSYGMYVFHWAIEFYFYRRITALLPDQYWIKALLFIPYLFIVYGFAELSFRFFENKFILLKDKYFSDKAKTREEAIIQNTDAVSAP